MTKKRDAFLFHKNAFDRIGPTEIKVDYNKKSGEIKLFFHENRQAYGMIEQGLEEEQIAMLVSEIISEYYDPVSGDLTRHNSIPN